MIVIIFALLTKKTLEALLLGTLSTYIIMYGFGFGSKWSEAFFTSAGNPDNQWVLIVCGLFGSLIALLRKSKGTLGFAGKLERYCKTQKSTLITTWILGILIFVDEYLNIMTLGACMKNISDKKIISVYNRFYRSTSLCIITIFNMGNILCQCFWKRACCCSIKLWK